MIRIAVVSRQGIPVSGASADFEPQGGTIGRADTNTLVLSDPERTVSRVHAQILCRDGQYVIIDRGSNPMQSNGRPLGSGREVPLCDGDRLVVGSFELQVEVVTAMPSVRSSLATAAPVAGDDDPFADLLAGLGSSASPPASVSPPAVITADQPFPDPLGGESRGALADAIDPFADLMAPPGAPASAARPAIDDFSDFGLSGMASTGANAQKIDALFGGIGAGLDGYPLALSPLADPMRQPNTAGADDPLAALQNAPKAAPASRSDHLPIGQFGYQPPRSIPTSTPTPVQVQDPPLFDDETGQPIRIARAPAPAWRESAGPLVVAAHPPTGPAMAADDRPFSGLSEMGTTGASVEPLLDVPEPPSIASSPLTVMAPAPASIQPATPNATVAAPSPRQPVSMKTTLGAMEEAELLAAFLRGLGPVHPTPSTLTPALMERIGVLLRGATEGTLQLLLTRQELKREVRAEMTMIAAHANNPLKFSPTVDVALAHLLGPGVRGFLPAEAAMRDAYDDLRAHQFGVMVGMRAALAKLIERFGPEQLEKKIAARSALDSLFAANRKAKLWDQFVALYSTIATEAEDDFHALFGQAFTEAYEEQMAKLKDTDAANLR